MFSADCNKSCSYYSFQMVSLFYLCVCAHGLFKACRWFFLTSALWLARIFFYCFGLDFVWKVRPARTGDYCSTQGMGEMYFWKQMAPWRGFSSRGAENKCTRLLRLPEIRCTYNSILQLKRKQHTISINLPFVSPYLSPLTITIFVFYIGIKYSSWQQLSSVFPWVS